MHRGILPALVTILVTACASDPPRCQPTSGGPHWLEEGSDLSAAVRCESGVEAHDFVVDPLPRGATWDAPTATLTWRPALDQAGVYKLKVTTGRETGEIKIGVADKFDDPTNQPVQDLAAYTEEFGLPVMHLQTTPDLARSLTSLQMMSSQLSRDPCTPLCLPSTYTPMTVIYGGRTYLAQGHYRGASSLGYPKKNYTLKFPKSDRFTEPTLAGGRMRNRQRIALITTFDDNSYLRWRMSFELWNRLDPKIIRIEHFSVVLYVDGKYVGLYALSDKIDEEMMQRNGLSETGNLFMAIDHNGNFDVLAKQKSGVDKDKLRPRNCGFEGFTKKEGLPEECNGATFVPQAYDDLVPFVEFVANADDVRFRAEIGRVADVREYIDWWVHASATVANDSYEKNALHYHDPVRGGPWRVVIWDYNASFGQDWNTLRLPTTLSPAGIADATAIPFINNLWRRLWKDPTYGPQMRARLAAALKSSMKLEDVLAAFDAMAAEVRPSALRDERLWGARHRMYYGPTSGTKRVEFNDHLGEIAYTRAWITARWDYLQAQFP